MAGLTFTQAQLDSLRDAIVETRGAKELEFDDQRIEMRGVSELQRLSQMMTQSANGSSHRRYRLAATSNKGL